jgi:hypothetical protein
VQITKDCVISLEGNEFFIRDTVKNQVILKIDGTRNESLTRRIFRFSEENTCLLVYTDKMGFYLLTEKYKQSKLTLPIHF